MSGPSDLMFRDGLPLQVQSIRPGIHRLSSCIEIVEPDRVLHGHLASVFLIVGRKATMLVDVGSAPFVAQLADAVTDLVGTRGLQYIFPTHLEHPHAGGVEMLADRFPEATIVGDTRDYHLYFPQLVPRSLDVRAGHELELGGGYRFTFLPALFKDMVSTLWGHEASQRIMFVADGFGYLHREAPDDLEAVVHSPDECTAFLSELPKLPSVEAAAVLNVSAMWWAHHRPVAPFTDAFLDLLKRYPSDLVAPAHGGVIDAIDAFIPVMQAGFDRAYANG